MTADYRMLSRRSFTRIGLTLLAGIGLGGCRTEPPPDPPASSESDASAGCTDPAALSDEVLRARAALGYVDETPLVGQRCDACQFWLIPEDGVPCGGCVVLVGPIRPEGTCNSWAPQA